MLHLRKKILVAIDGSPLSDKAAEEAVRMAACNPGPLKSTIYALLVLPNAPRNTFTDFVPSPPITETEKWQELKERIFATLGARPIPRASTSATPVSRRSRSRRRRSSSYRARGRSCWGRTSSFLAAAWMAVRIANSSPPRGRVYLAVWRRRAGCRPAPASW